LAVRSITSFFLSLFTCSVIMVGTLQPENKSAFYFFSS
jgi:hypothetical protein